MQGGVDDSEHEGFKLLTTLGKRPKESLSKRMDDALQRYCSLNQSYFKIWPQSFLQTRLPIRKIKHSQKCRRIFRHPFSGIFLGYLPTAYLIYATPELRQDGFQGFGRLRENCLCSSQFDGKSKNCKTNSHISIEETT